MTSLQIIALVTLSTIKLHKVLVLVLKLMTPDNCGNGFDGTIMSSVNAMDPFHDYFGTKMQGASIGAVFALYNVGQIVGCFVAAPASDGLGRRKGMAIGSAFLIIGAVIQATAKNIGTFMAGRFFLGLGCTLAMTAAPVYLVEIAYPSWRGALSGLYNVFGWYIGSLGGFHSARFETCTNILEHLLGPPTARADSPQTGPGESPLCSRLYQLLLC